MKQNENVLLKGGQRVLTYSKTVEALRFSTSINEISKTTGFLPHSLNLMFDSVLGDIRGKVLGGICAMLSERCVNVAEQTRHNENGLWRNSKASTNIAQDA